MALTRRSPRLSSHAATSKAPTGSTSSTDTVLASAMVHSPGKIRIGVPVLVTWLVLWMGLNFLLLWWWDAIRSYFPLTLHQEEHFDASKRYLFVIHPHGIISFSAWLSFAADSAELSRKNSALDIAMATVNANFYIPFWRDVLLAMGLVDASFQLLTAVLGRGRSVAVVLGGAAEALDAHPNTNDIILDKRKGIVRLALSSGTPLVPVFVFGESDLFYQVESSTLPVLMYT
ncbi:Diacylglycerol acyltransferase, partial [Globisporangium splendens]